MRAQVRNEIESIVPIDELEQQHRESALAWVDSGAELFRLTKPADPPKHLVSYFAVVDDDHILLVDHRNAQLWLPAGGHVEPSEHPRTTVAREMKEELGFEPAHKIEAPLMITCTSTVGLTAGHVDVSLWYVVRANRTQTLHFDQGEFLSVRWFPFSQVPFERAEPHLNRFIFKLRPVPSIERTR